MTLPLAFLVASLLAWPSPVCRALGLLPDRACSPGAVSATSLAVVCGESTRLRRHVTEATKRRVLAEYGVAWEDRRGWIVDHVVPIELGGDGSALANLWPQREDDARRKDRLENRTRARVCAGAMDLAEAQRVFATDWTAVR